ncbi:hypothetical protein VCHA54P500_80169 [Vibrio chagasii]|nr:hypothetical protein VCHA34P117_80168 [Vibrio chagasii]CAH7363903.1 hypothetical protein VCHA40O236_80158 [Vibrio chagasii]CAH7412200.1 hypothetical protein VCHA54P500_80169 [Vibrio chagasii]
MPNIDSHNLEFSNNNEIFQLAKLRFANKATIDINANIKYNNLTLSTLKQNE